jgi:hypothetical protein
MPSLPAFPHDFPAAGPSLEAGPDPRWDGTVDHLAPLLIGFVSLLLIPSLGVINLFKKPVTPILSAAMFVWLLGGVWALSTGWHAGLGHDRFLRLWLLGLTVGGGFLLVARLREKRRAWKWIRLAMTAATIVVFIRALITYLDTFAT